MNESTESVYVMTDAELAYHQEQARDAEEQARRQRDGLRKLAARFDADTVAARRCARILATLASDWSLYWDADDVARERSRKYADALDVDSVDDDLEALCEAGLVEVAPRDDGDEDGPPTEFWGAYAIRRDDLDEMLVLGTERWIARQVDACRGSA